MLTRMPFQIVAVNQLFRFNGNDYVKQSTRTARMLSNGRVFYIGRLDMVDSLDR